MATPATPQAAAKFTTHGDVGSPHKIDETGAIWQNRHSLANTRLVNWKHCV